MRKLYHNKKAISKSLIALFIVLIILIGTLGASYFDLLPRINREAQQTTKTSFSVDDKLTQLVQNRPYKNPLVPVFFHYLDRYFNNLSTDAIDLAVAQIMNALSKTEKDSFANLLASYKNHTDILAPIIPEAYAIPLSGTVNSTKFRKDLREASMLMEFGGLGDVQTLEWPGLIRQYPGEEFGPEVLIQYVNDYWDLTVPARIQPGQRVILLGANFYNVDLTVKIESGPYRRVLSGDEVHVMGDLTTPLGAPRTEVRDRIVFFLPYDISPGLYDLTVTVPPPSGSGLTVDAWDTRIIVVPSPTGEKFTVHVPTVYCEDETNPETTIFGINIDDETFFTFIVGSGDRLWTVSTKQHDFDDDTSRTLEADESAIYGEQGVYTEVDQSVHIAVAGYEVDSGETAEKIIEKAAAFTATILTAGGQPEWAAVAVAAGELISLIIGLFEGVVTVAEDIITWTSDDLYMLTAEPRPQWATVQWVEEQNHPDSIYETINIRGYDLSMLTYPQPSGIQVRIPYSGDYKFSITPNYSVKSFTLWRGYQNFNEPSQYFLKFTVQRQ